MRFSLKLVLAAFVAVATACGPANPGKDAGVGGGGGNLFTGGGGGTTGGGGGGSTGGGGGATGGGGGDDAGMGGGGGSTGGGGGDDAGMGGGGGSTGGGGGATGGGGGDDAGMGGGGGSTGGGGGGDDAGMGGGGGTTGGGGGSTGGGGGSTGGGGGSTGGGGGDDAGMGGGGGSTGGGGGSTGGGGGDDAGMGGGTGGGGMTASGEDCANAIELTSGTTVMTTTTDAGNDFAFVDGNGCQGSSSLSSATAGDKVFHIQVPAFSRVTATLNTTFDSTFNLISGAMACGANQPDAGTVGVTCVAGRDDPDNSSLTWANATAAAQDIYLLADGYGTGEGAITVGATVTAIPAGDLCANAVALSGATTLPTETIVGFANDYASGTGCATGSSAGDRVYSVTVPAGQRITATATAALTALADGGTTATFNPGVHIVTGTCAATLNCLASTNVSSGPDVVVWDNNGTTDQAVFVVVDTSTSTPAGGGEFSLTVALTAAGPAGDSCGAAGTPITASTNLTSETFAGFTSHYASNGQSICRYGTGPDRVYAVDIPAGEILTATLIPAAGTLPDGGAPDLTLSVVDPMNDCNIGPCLSGSDNTGGANEVATVSNSAGATVRRVNVVVDSKDPMSPGYGLSVALAPPLAGDVCSSVGTPITASATFAMESLVPYVNDYTSALSTTCVFASGQDRVYAATIGAGKTLTVAATATTDLAVNIVDGPAASACNVSPIVCASAADDNSSGTETATFTNSGTTDKTVLIIIDRFGSASGTETFSLAVTIPLCGDGVIEGGETCDDGNTSASDGCSASCFTESGWVCTGTPSACIMATCGNGVIEASESCDDGNTASGDGCSATCALQLDYACTGAPSVCTPVETSCGDGTDNDGDTQTDCADTDCAAGCLAYFPACAMGQTLQVFNSTVNLPVVDNNVTGVTTTMRVPAVGTIARLAMRYSITHTYDSDLDLSLKSPSGTFIDISSDNGGSGANYVNTLLDTTCTTAVTSGSAPFTGCYRPETAFTSYAGTSPGGAWQFKIVDDAGGDDGTIQNWSLVMCITP